MNKKFSTFLASILLAGALVGTADAKLKPLATGTAPTIGSSYVLATEFTAADGTVKNNVVISSSNVTLEKTTAAELTAFGTEWTLEAAEAEGTFYLTSKGKYLKAEASSSSLVDAKADATVFSYDKADNVIKTANNDKLVVESNALKVAASTGDAIKLGTLTAEVDGQTLISNPTDGNYYYVASAKADGTDVENYMKYDATNGIEGDANADGSDAFLWKITKGAINGKVTYTFTSKAEPEYSKTYLANVAYNNGFNLYTDMDCTKPLKNDFSDGSSVADLCILGVYLTSEQSKKESELNAILGSGFELTIDTEKDADETIEGISAFEGTLVATDGADADNARFQLKNGKKYIVLDTEATWGAANVGANKRGYKFDLMDEDDIDATKQYAWFEFVTNAGTVDKKQVNKVRVYASKDATEEIGCLYIMTLAGKNYLTTSKQITTEESWPYLYLGSDNIVKVKDLVGKFWTIKYADTRANAKKDEAPYKEEYKYKGILVAQAVQGAATTANQADYVPASTVYNLAPEAQWGVTGANLNDNKVTLTNRESKETITGVQFRKVGDNYIMYADGSIITQDLVTLEPVEASETDGYAVFTENELKNNNFYLGQYHAIDGNNHAYYVENHAGSHQIGMTAIKEDADKWNLHLATRTVKVDGVEKQVIDTVFVHTDLIKLKADGSLDDEKTKTYLAILPYAFQKVGNKEFVDFKGGNNYDYYYCNPDNKEEANDATRFALKMKADGSYNFVEIVNEDEANKLDADDEDKLDDTKVRVANSLNKGSLKTMGLYAEDDNSLMVIEKAESPEYHKITNNVWGDTIQLARANNLDQVIYEQYEAAASELLKDQVSFLNIENVNDPKFDGLNGAIFADTAYINRGENTCWQYLLAVRPSFGYHNENCNIPGHPAIASSDVDTVYGDFLVNLIDTANLYAIDHLHKNPYLIEDKTGEPRAKLSFVPGFHTNDTLYIVRASGDTVKLGMDTPDFNVAKFAFRYVDQEAKSFKIQTQFKEFIQNAASEEEIAERYEDRPGMISNEGYLAWENGVLAVMPGIEQGDVFTISEGVKKTPTANDEIAVSEVSVVAVDGAVIVKGAAGKTIAISNILGKTIANTTIASDNETISVPAGIAVVAVDGEEAVKVVVK